MKQKNKAFIRLLGTATMLIIVIIWFQFFLTIYNNPEQRVCVDINKFKEANFDLFCGIIVLFFGIWALILDINDFRIVK